MLKLLKALFIDYEFMQIPRKYSQAKIITSKQQFGLCLGYILSCRQNHYYNCLFISDNKTVKNYCTSILKEDWDIVDLVSSRQVLDWYFEVGDRFYYNDIIKIFSTNRPQAEQIIEDRYGKNLVQSISNLDQMLKTTYGKKWYPNKNFSINTNAFDYGRMIFTARNCYVANYLSEEETWKYIEKFSEIAKRDFTNWEDYAKSYMLGLATWAGNYGGNFNRLAKQLAVLLRSPYSPWQKYKWGY